MKNENILKTVSGKTFSAAAVVVVHYEKQLKFDEMLLSFLSLYLFCKNFKTFCFWIQLSIHLVLAQQEKDLCLALGLQLKI